MTFWRLLVRNLFRNRRRTWLTVVSVAISFFLFSSLASLPAAVDSMLRNSEGSLRLVCHSKAGLTYFLPNSLKPRIAAFPHVAAVVGWVYFGGVYRGPSDRFDSLASDTEQFGQMFSDWLIPADALERFEKHRTAALVSNDVLNRFGWRPGQRIALRSTIKGLYPRDLPLEIAGSLGSKAPPGVVLLRRDYLQAAERDFPMVTYFWVKADQPSQLDAVVRGLDETFANSEYETQTETERGYYGLLLSALRNLIRLFEALGIIMLVAVGIIAANTAAMSTRERQRETAIMRAIGFTSEGVMALIVGESMLMGLLGGSIGCLGGYLLQRGLPQLIGLPFAMPASVVLFSALLSAAMGLLSALVPALITSRRTVVETMRAMV